MHSLKSPSQARYLFERFTGSGAVAILQDLPGQTPPVFETDKLDFKTGRFNPQHVPRIFSKALGAFANNAGGVIVWGVRADKHPDSGIDAAHAVEPVTDVYALVNRLKELHPFATDPPVKGVESVGVPIPGQEPAGFVVTHVPESSFKPHRSEQDGKKFFLRMGDSGQECSVAILRQLFYPVVTPRIEVTFRAMPKPDDFPRVRLMAGMSVEPASDDLIHIRVENTGLATLHNLVAEVVCGSATLMNFQYNQTREGFDLSIAPERIILADFLHAGMTADIRLLAAIHPDQRNPPWMVSLFSKDAFPMSFIVQHQAILKEGDDLAGKPTELIRTSEIREALGVPRLEDER